MKVIRFEAVSSEASPAFFDFVRPEMRAVPGGRHWKGSMPAWKANSQSLPPQFLEYYPVSDVEASSQGRPCEGFE